MITFSFTVARPSVTVKADGVLPSGITVLTGQSGSGKSTFIKCIAGLVKPTTGSIRCNEITWVNRDLGSRSKTPGRLYATRQYRIPAFVCGT